MKLKIGDKVKRISGKWGDMVVGDIDTIVGFNKWNNLILKKFGNGHDKALFELVKESNRFIIGGKPLLLQAFAEELKDIGYGVDVYNNADVIVNNWNDKGNLSVGIAFEGHSRIKQNKAEKAEEFTLPDQWKEAKEYCQKLYDESKVEKTELNKFYYHRGSRTLFFPIAYTDCNSTGGYTLEVADGSIRYHKHLTASTFDKMVCEEISIDELGDLFTEIVKKIYKVGDTIDQNLAYNGAGGKFVIRQMNTQVQYDDYNKRYNLSVGNVGVFNTNDFKWAPVVQHPKEYRGYTLSHKDGIVRIGCKEFTVADLRELARINTEYNMVTHVDGKIWAGSDIQNVLKLLNL